MGRCPICNEVVFTHTNLTNGVVRHYEIIDGKTPHKCKLVTTTTDNNLSQELVQIEGLKYRERKSAFVGGFWDKNEKPAGVLCCPFSTLAWSNGCMFECAYCYLRGTFPYGIDYSRKDAGNDKHPWRGKEQVVFTNTDRLFAEVEKFLQKPKGEVLHTGELADSLAVPGSEKFMARLIERFGQQNRHTLLLLTKSANIDGLVGLEHNNRTVIGFSINCNPVAQLYERGAALPADRIAAASKCIAAGYRVLVRIDPMIPIEGWQDEYGKLFHAINELTSEGLYGVVVGTLRAFGRTMQALPADLQAMLPDKDNVDRRYHVDKATRDAMYDLAFTTLKSKNIGVCKESGEMWASLLKKHGARNFVCNCHLPEKERRGDA